MNERLALDRWSAAVDALLGADETEPPMPPPIERILGRIPTSGKAALWILDTRSASGRRLQLLLRLTDQNGDTTELCLPPSIVGALVNELQGLMHIL